MAPVIRRSVLLSVAALALGPPAACAAVADSVVPFYDTSDGVSVGHGSNGIRFLRFGPKAARIYRGLAGRNALVACGTVTPKPNGGKLVSTGFGSSEMKLPRKRGRVYLLDDRRDAELCTVSTKRTKADRSCLSNSAGDKRCVRVIVAL